jgi:hypothetical protein
MKTIMKTALVALTLTVGGAPAQAHTIWRFPYKGAPYAVPHEHKGSVAVTGKAKSLLRRTYKRSSVVENPAIVVAHHKQPYHDGLPRTSGPRSPDTRRSGKTGADADLTAPALSKPVALV